MIHLVLHDTTVTVVGDVPHRGEFVLSRMHIGT